jgi:hypothetical protein
MVIWKLGTAFELTVPLPSLRRRGGASAARRTPRSKRAHTDDGAVGAAPGDEHRHRHRGRYAGSRGNSGRVRDRWAWSLSKVSLGGPLSRARGFLALNPRRNLRQSERVSHKAPLQMRFGLFPCCSLVEARFRAQFRWRPHEGTSTCRQELRNLVSKAASAVPGYLDRPTQDYIVRSALSP